MRLAAFRPPPRFALMVATVLTACGPPPRAAVADWSLERDVVYTPAGWPQAQKADLYRPGGAGPFPAVLVVHGGGWNARDRSDMDSVSRKLVRRGYVVANIDYRLAPQWLHPAQLDDLRAAIGWLHDHAAALRVDPQRIGGWGYSAGAHLVALAATVDSARAQRLRAVVAGGIPSDLPRYPQSPIITRFIGAPYMQAPARWIEASPLHHVSAQSPPMFLYHGGFDRLVHAGQSRAMKAALDRVGVDAELYVVPGSGHITTFLFGFGAEGAGLSFLDRHLRPPR